MNKILIIDNYDSFTANLEHLIAVRTGHKPCVVSYSDIKTQDFNAFNLAIISPGPGKPNEYSNYKFLIESGIPALGICLGMQVLAEHYGGKISKLPGCVHGRAEEIKFDSRRLFVARYHSLYVQDIPDCFEILATNKNSIPMAIRHKELPLLGYQFHPESFMTPDGGYFIDYAFDKFKEYYLRTV